MQPLKLSEDQVNIVCEHARPRPGSLAIDFPNGPSLMLNDNNFVLQHPKTLLTFGAKPHSPLSVVHQGEIFLYAPILKPRHFALKIAYPRKI